MDNERNSKCWYKNVCKNKCSDTCIRFIEMSHLMDTSDIPKSKQFPSELEAGQDYETFCMLADIKSNIKEWVEQGQNLYICSKYTGNGKTSWAIKLMLKYFDEIWAGNGLRVRGLFVHAPTLLMQLKNFNAPLSEEYKQNILNCDLIILDDISEANMSSYDYSNLLMFVDNRILNEKSIIFTSNRTTKENLEEVVGVRLASRIWETSTIAEFVGKDRRG